MHFYADHAEQFLTGELLDNPGSVGASRAWTRWEPMGVVLAVMPWNLPLWQVIRFATPALMAGNTGLLKHASNVPRSVLYLDTLFERGGFPTGAFRTLLISASDVASVITDPRVLGTLNSCAIALILSTSATTVGRRRLVLKGPRGSKIRHLGGKTPPPSPRQE